MKKVDREVFERAEELMRFGSKVIHSKEVIVGTPTWRRLRNLWLALDEYVVEYSEGE